jgi:tetratricopeptide (TPR) repeat protein
MIADPLAASASFRSRFSSWLLRPYIDLGPFVLGPLYARGIGEYWRSLCEPAAPLFYLQRTLPPTFRRQLLDESGRREFLVDDPREVSRDLWTQRWSALCGSLNEWNDHSQEQRLRLVLMLHSLCLYRPVLGLVGAFHRRFSYRSPAAVELTYWRASAQYVLGLPRRVAQYRDADLSVFEAIGRDQPDSVHASFNAAVKVLVHKAKTGTAPKELAEWAGHAKRALAEVTSRVDTFTSQLLTSRFYRAMGYVPMRQGDRAEVVRLMDQAERFALSMKPGSAAQELLCLENLHPVMESRTKEALWLGELDLALERAQKVIDLDPYDSKAWVELGEVRLKRKESAQAAEAYMAAAMLGPPASAIGRHMAGVCLRECGQDLLAAFLFQDALKIDPLGISPHQEIHELPDLSVLRALKEWSIRTWES